MEPRRKATMRSASQAEQHCTSTSAQQALPPMSRDAVVPVALAEQQVALSGPARAILRQAVGVAEVT